MANKPKMPKVQLKVTLADVGMILGVHLPSLAAQWPTVKTELKATKDTPAVAAFKSTIEEIYRLVST